MDCCRVSDPYSFDTDPDPAFRLNTNPVPDSIRVQGFDDQKNLKKSTAEFFFFFLIKNYNLPIPRPP